MNGERVLLAYSGGLDTSYLAAWLSAEGHRVSALSIDCGAWNAEERELIAKRAKDFGAEEHRFVDARSELFERVLRWLIAGNVRRGGTYPLCVGAERGLQAEILARIAQAEGFDAVAHGCTGAGNDQVRFESALAVVAEGVRVLAPIRDSGIQRDEERDWLASNGYALDGTDTRYSINAGLWGLTIGGGEMLSGEAPLPADAWQLTGSTRPTHDTESIEIGFRGGIPVTLDGEALDPVALIERLNDVAGAAGVGRGYHLGDTVLGHKGRIGFEAPAAEVLLGAHRELEKLVLTEEQRFWKDHLGEVYGKKLHQGGWHEPFLRDVEALFASSQARVEGEVDVLLAGGRALVQAVASPFSMLAASDALYGERPSAGSDPSGAIWLARTMAEPARLARRAHANARVTAEVQP